MGRNRVAVGGLDGVFAVRDGGDVEDGMWLGQRVVAGVVAQRAFVAPRLARVNVAFDDESRPAGRQALAKTVFKFGQNLFKARPTRRNESKSGKICAG